MSLVPCGSRTGALALGGELTRFRAVSIESKRGELGARALLDQALNFKAPGGKLW